MLFIYKRHIRRMGGGHTFPRLQDLGGMHLGDAAGRVPLTRTPRTMAALPREQD